MSDAAETTPEYPPGEYAIIELLGHQTMIGRVEEIERFGTKMLAVEVVWRDTLLPQVLHGGGSVYRFTPCPAEVAFKRQAKRAYELPDAVRAIVPQLLLEAPAKPVVDAQQVNDDDDDDRPF